MYILASNKYQIGQSLVNIKKVTVNLTKINEKER